MQEPVEAPEELPVEEAWGGRGKEAWEEPQKLIPQPIPIDLDPSAIAQPKESPLPVASSQNPVYILLAAQFTPEAPAPKAESIPSALPVHNFRKLVATVQAFATTSRTLVATHIAWHSGWFGCWFGFGASEPRHF